MLRADDSYLVHDLLTHSPDGASFGGIRFEGAPRLPVIEQPMAGVVAIIDGASLIKNDRPETPIRLGGRAMGEMRERMAAGVPAAGVPARVVRELGEQDRGEVPAGAPR